MKLFTIVLLIAALTPNFSSIQTQQISVPDLKGLSAPEAARVAGEAGLLFKGEIQQQRLEGASVQANQISDQQPTAGQKVAAGTEITVTVLRDYNTELLYDAQQITLRNMGKTPLALTGISFRSGADKTQKVFTVADWGNAALEPGACYQLTLATRAKTPTPIPPSACTKIIRTLPTPANSTKLFWQADFQIARNDHIMTTCAQTDGKCSAALPQGDDPENAGYLNFNYRDRHLSVRNDSTRWMVLSNIEATGRNGKKLRLDSLDNLTPGDVPWAGQRLAPGQCIVYSEFSVAELPPYDCHVVGYIKLPTGGNFWTRGFTIRNVITSYSTSCGSPKPGLLSLCLVQREAPLK